MGTGKSRVGEKLAQKLGREFLELDDIIEKKEGMPIKEIFEKEGEDYFRKIEKEAVKEAAKREGIVMSAGGGAIIDEENVNHFKDNGILICLEASVDVILQRTKAHTCRPLLNVPDPRKKVEELLKERAAYYKKADFCVNTDNLTIEQIVKKIIELI